MLRAGLFGALSKAAVGKRKFRKGSFVINRGANPIEIRKNFYAGVNTVNTAKVPRVYSIFNGVGEQTHDGRARITTAGLFVVECFRGLQWRRFSSSSIVDDKYENGTEEKRMVVEYDENSRQLNKVEVEPWMLSLPLAILKVGKLQVELKKYRYLKQLNWIRVVIDRWETNYGVINCKIDWKTVNELSDKIDKSKEIRRQRWIHILTKEVTHSDVKNLLNRLSIYGISVPEFAEDIADGYDLISDAIKSVIHENAENLFVTKNKNVNRSLNVLMEDIETKVGQEIKRS